MRATSHRGDKFSDRCACLLKALTVFFEAVACTSLRTNHADTFQNWNSTGMYDVQGRRRKVNEFCFAGLHILCQESCWMGCLTVTGSCTWKFLRHVKKGGANCSRTCFEHLRTKFLCPRVPGSPWSKLLGRPLLLSNGYTYNSFLRTKAPCVALGSMTCKVSFCGICTCGLSCSIDSDRWRNKAY